MLYIDPRLLRNLDSLDNIRSALQVAIRLEHSTIPPYLTAAWSLTGNDDVVSLITDVAVEEMLHMTLVCNILNALGGQPVLNDPQFVPRYPGRLPGMVHTSFSVGIESFSKNLLRDTFMVIEEPEVPLDREAPPATACDHRSILSQAQGMYYRAKTGRLFREAGITGRQRLWR